MQQQANFDKKFAQRDVDHKLVKDKMTRQLEAQNEELRDVTKKYNQANEALRKVQVAASAKTSTGKDSTTIALPKSKKAGKGEKSKSAFNIQRQNNIRSRKSPDTKGVQQKASSPGGKERLRSQTLKIKRINTSFPNEAEKDPLSVVSNISEEVREDSLTESIEDGSDTVYT